MKQFEISINRSVVFNRLLPFLVIFELCLVLLDTVFNYNALIPTGSIQRLFNVAREDSLNAWLSSVVTLFAGIAVLLIYCRSQKRGWGIIGAFFVYLAMDDGAKIHERIGTGVKKLLLEKTTEDGLAQLPSYTWQFVLGPIFATMGFWILYFIWREVEVTRTRILIFVALSCYAVAMGLDFIEGMNPGYSGIADAISLSSVFVNHYGRVLEEFLELLGSSIFFVAFFEHFARIAPQISVKFK